jgi:hypothetical protein
MRTIHKRTAAPAKLRPKICECCRDLVSLDGYRADHRYVDDRVLVCKTCERAAREKRRDARRAATLAALEKWRAERARKIPTTFG